MTDAAFKRTTVASQRPIDASDLIGQDFPAEQPDTRWCGDVTYVQTVDGWVYTATVIDLHSRKVVGYAVADHLRTSLIVEALAAALVTRRSPADVIFHSDRGWAVHLPRVRRRLRRKRSSPFDGATRHLLRQCGLRVVLRHLQEGADSHSAMARRHRGPTAHIPVDTRIRARRDRGFSAAAHGLHR